MQRPTIPLGACMGTPAHDWRVASWVDFEIQPEPDEKDGQAVHGRSAAGYFCARCLAQADASVLYSEREKAESTPIDVPPGDPRAHAGALERLRDELAQAAVIGDGTPEGEEAAARAAALDAVLAKPAP
jgi:hypothetical protein